MRGLIIDDSRALRRILRSMLEGLHFEIIEACNGQEGLDRLHEQGTVDIVLVDWNMPEMNGLEFVQAVRRDPTYQQLPLLMVTTETDMEQIATALQAGVTEYLMKPFDQESLMDKLQQLGFATTIS